MVVAAGQLPATLDILLPVRADSGGRTAPFEALGLLRADVDLDQGVLTIRETKFGKSRLVPLHATTIAVLSGYAARRDAHLGTLRSPYFFVAEQGGRLLHQYVHRVFCRLSRQIGLKAGGESRWPTGS
ncbi:tyrosine-type recombinase/integrase [Sinorhizobium meliloti]|uniref:tyrosine-type recombinase/integrase n=1 Tax=Rhizobium meliloti TaxID=382 RepID=UPI00299F1AA8